MNEELVEKLFPGTINRIKNKICTICEQNINLDEFKDRLSLKEYKISGMCQSCQDITFK